MKLLQEYNICLNDEIKKSDREALLLISKLDGCIENSSFQNIYKLVTLLKEILNNNEIENIHTTYLDLLNALTGSINISKETKTVFSNIDAIEKGIEYTRKYDFIDKKIFIEIQQIIRNTTDEFRKLAGVKIINDKREVVYTPPQQYDEIIHYTNDLELYINDQKTDNEHGLITKMAIAHYQFESIHPFNDGNGRTGRIINLLFLILRKVISNPIFSLSYYIVQNKKEYYQKLNQIHQDETKINEFINYMINGVKHSSIDGTTLLKEIEKAFNQNLIKTKNILNKTSFSDFLELFNKLIFDNNDFSKILNISRNTSLKYLNILEREKIISKINLKSKHYIFNDILNLFK